MLELHLSILQGVAARYRTPFFSALKQYSHTGHERAQTVAGRARRTGSGLESDAGRLQTFLVSPE
jgi:hypothetical protein